MKNDNIPKSHKCICGGVFATPTGKYTTKENVASIYYKCTKCDNTKVLSQKNVKVGG